MSVAPNLLVKPTINTPEETTSYTYLFANKLGSITQGSEMVY
jgi:hypothetical protein